MPSGPRACNDMVPSFRPACRAVTTRPPRDAFRVRAGGHSSIAFDRNILIVSDFIARLNRQAVAAPENSHSGQGKSSRKSSDKGSPAGKDLGKISRKGFGNDSGGASPGEDLAALPPNREAGRRRA